MNEAARTSSTPRGSIQSAKESYSRFKRTPLGSYALMLIEGLFVFLLFFVPQYVSAQHPRLPIEQNDYFTNLNSVYYSSSMIARGHVPEAGTQVNTRLPLSTYANAAGLRLLGDEVRSLYTISAFLVGTAGVFLWLVIRPHVSAGWLFFILMLLVIGAGKFGRVPDAAQYSSCLVLGAAYLLQRQIMSPTRSFNLIGAGVMLGLAYCGKSSIALVFASGAALFILLEPVFRMPAGQYAGVLVVRWNTIYLWACALLAASLTATIVLFAAPMNVWALLPVVLLMGVVLHRAISGIVSRRVVVTGTAIQDIAKNLLLLFAGGIAALIPFIALTSLRSGVGMLEAMSTFVPVWKSGETLFAGSADFFRFFAVDSALIALLALGICFGMLAIRWSARTASPAQASNKSTRLFRLSFTPAQIIVLMTCLTWVAGLALIRWVKVGGIETKALYILLLAIGTFLPMRASVRMERSHVLFLLLAACGFSAAMWDKSSYFAFTGLFIPLLAVLLVICLARPSDRLASGVFAMVRRGNLAALAVMLAVLGYGEIRDQLRTSHLAFNDFYNAWTTPSRDLDIRRLQEFIAWELPDRENLFVLSNNLAPYVLSSKSYLDLPKFESPTSDDQRRAQFFLAAHRPEFILAMDGRDEETGCLSRIGREYPELVRDVLNRYQVRSQIGSFVIMEPIPPVGVALGDDLQ